MMKKLSFIAILLALLVPMAISAQQVQLTSLWHVDASAAGYAEDQGIRATFAQNNPDINITYEELYNVPYQDKLTAYIAAGTLPDIMFLWPTTRSGSGIIQAKHLAKDLAQLLGKDFLANFNPTAIDPKLQAGKYLAELPEAITYTTVMYTNTKMLSDLGIALPKTYADLKAMTPKLRVKGLQTVLMANGGGSEWTFQSCLFSTIVGRLLGDSWVDSTIAGKTKFTDPEFVNALKFVQTMYTDHVIDWSNTQVNYGEDIGLFAGGKAAFYIQGDWRQGNFLVDKSTGVGLIAADKQATDFAFLNFPTIPGEKYASAVSAILGTGYAVSAAIPAGSDKEKAAVRFMKYLYSPEVQRIRLETGAYIPTLKGVTSDKLQPFTLAMPKYYASIPRISYVLDGVLDAAVANAINTGLLQIGLGAKTPTQVAADIQKELDAWKAKNP